MAHCMTTLSLALLFAFLADSSSAAPPPGIGIGAGKAQKVRVRWVGGAPAPPEEVAETPSKLDKLIGRRFFLAVVLDDHVFEYISKRDRRHPDHGRNPLPSYYYEKEDGNPPIVMGTQFGGGKLKEWISKHDVRHESRADETVLAPAHPVEFEKFLVIVVNDTEKEQAPPPPRPEN